LSRRRSALKLGNDAPTLIAAWVSTSGEPGICFGYSFPNQCERVLKEGHLFDDTIEGLIQVAGATAAVALHKEPR
jgi:hypothetical protein